ncbi:MAG TPA: hypothetical protein VIJ33_08885, partial [Solirubrobacteraceae bacterium]
SINVMLDLGILEAHEVAELLKPRHSTVLDLSRRGILPAFKVGKALALPARRPRGVDDRTARRRVTCGESPGTVESRRPT